MSAKYSFKDLSKKAEGVILIPCIYDCCSARAAELSGAKATLLSGGELGESLGVLEPMLTVDEIVNRVERICAFSPLPCMIDVGAGFDTPINAYYTAKRMIRAGAMALLLGNERGQSWEDYMPILKATIKACEGTECIVVCRCNDPTETQEQLDSVIEFLNKGVDLGADTTMACGLCRCDDQNEKAAYLGQRVKGWKVYPDQNSVNGIPDVDNNILWENGFKMVSYHYMMKVALNAMWRFGLENEKNRNNVASNEVEFPNGLKGHSALGCMPFQQYYDLEGDFTGVYRKHRVPGSKAGRENG